MRMFTVTVIGIALATSGCATKRYGRMQPLTYAETEAYDCRQLDIEIAKVEAFRQQVADGAQVNLASVAGFLGDWGIGNSMEKNSAEKSATERMNDLLAARTAKGCGRTQMSAQEKSAIEKTVSERLQAPPTPKSTPVPLQKNSRVRCDTCPR